MKMKYMPIKAQFTTHIAHQYLRHTLNYSILHRNFEYVSFNIRTYTLFKNSTHYSELVDLNHEFEN